MTDNNKTNNNTNTTNINCMNEDAENITGEDINNIIRMLDGLTDNEVSRIKIETDENLPDNSVKREYHHGRCDIGSPWARGCAFDVLEPDEE